MKRHLRAFVAPRVGAWIETLTLRYYNGGWMSHPVSVRGLKQGKGNVDCDSCKSHPVSVRGLKLTLAHYPMTVVLSHPVSVRGLKQAELQSIDVSTMSHPVSVRGLKLYLNGL